METNRIYGVVGVPDSDEKEIGLILGIYQLDETPISLGGMPWP